MLNVTIVGDKEVITQLKAMPAAVTRELTKEAMLQGSKLRNHIIVNKLSGQALNKRSGRLQQSIQFDVETNPGVSVLGKAFSSGDVKYAGIHEFGGIIQHPGGTPYFISDLLGGKAFFVRKSAMFAEHLPKTKAHPIKIPARSFMRSSLKDRTPEIVKGFTMAVMRGAKL